MSTVILEVRSLDDTLAEVARDVELGMVAPDTRMAFATPELLRELLDAERWQLVHLLCASGPLSVDDIAARLARPLDSISSDIRLLVNAGVLLFDADGRIGFPFDAVRVEFAQQPA